MKTTFAPLFLLSLLLLFLLLLFFLIQLLLCILSHFASLGSKPLALLT